MRKYEEKYAAMVQEGVCAHAAAAAVIGAVYSDCRDQGLTFEESLAQGRKLLKRLRPFKQEEDIPL